MIKINYEDYLNNPLHTFVISEVGSNWVIGNEKENVRMAKQLIDIASKAGSDAIKFQTYRSKNVYVENAGTPEYLGSESENINKIFDEHSMPYEIIPDLAEYCNKQKIMFMSTPFSVQDAKNIEPYVSIHKIASYEINHLRLLEFLANTQKPIILSTGAASYSEIDFAVNNIQNKTNFALLQCTAKYPTPIDSLNLNVIPTLKKKYCVPVGLSDHSLDPIIAPLTAIGLGATIIEKHFTMNKDLPGPDHRFALDPLELSEMIRCIRLADKSKGNGEKSVTLIENELWKFATRSIQAIKEIKKDEKLIEGKNIEILRPGNKKKGEPARFIHDFLGKKINKNISMGDGIKFEDVE